MALARSACHAHRFDVHRFCTTIIDALAPPSCAFCRLPLTGGESGACVDCLNDLPWAGEARVPLGVTPLPVYAPLEYTFPLDAAIRAWKFQRRLFYEPVFADIICEVIAELPVDVDAVLPVPLHWRRLAIRGFNQAEVLARAVGDAMSVPMLRNVYRVRATPQQSGLNAAERRRNLRGVFTVRGDIHSQHVLLVDDVVTTGETLLALAACVKSAGAKNVSALTLARTARDS